VDSNIEIYDLGPLDDEYKKIGVIKEIELMDEMIKKDS